MNQLGNPVLAHLNVLGDPLRARLLLVLDGQTLSVGELCDILQLPQSTVSRHLKTLVAGGWAHARREGTSRLYALSADELDAPAAELWRLVKGQLLETPGVWSNCPFTSRQSSAAAGSRSSALSAYNRLVPSRRAWAHPPSTRVFR